MSQPSTSSGELTASAVVSNRPCLLMGIIVHSTSGAADVVLYDSATGAVGTPKARFDATVGTAGNFHIDAGVVFNNGIYASISGAAPQIYVFFSPA